jgi:hypothetical protein
MFVRRPVRPLSDCEKKIFKKISKEKKSQTRYISRMRGAPLSNRLQWKFAHRFRSPTLSTMRIVVVGELVWFVRRVEYWLFPQEADMALTTLPGATALACDG